jgi:hypothetical protein
MALPVRALCVSFNEEQRGRWVARCGEVPMEHHDECEGGHGRVMGEFVRARDGECSGCGAKGERFTPNEPGWPLVCGGCVVSGVLDGWLLMAFMDAGRRNGQEWRKGDGDDDDDEEEDGAAALKC